MHGPLPSTPQEPPFFSELLSRLDTCGGRLSNLNDAIGVKLNAIIPIEPSPMDSLPFDETCLADSAKRLVQRINDEICRLEGLYEHLNRIV